MALFEKWKERFTFPVKIYYLKLFFIVIALAGAAFINKNQIGAMQSFAGVLIGVLTFFLVTAVLTDYLNKLRVVSDKLQKEFNKQISKSINAERRAKKYSAKLNHLWKREFLYKLAGEMDIEKIHSAFLCGYIALISSVLLSLFEFVTPVDLTYKQEDVIFTIWQLSSWHIVYVLLILGLFFVLKLIFYFNEMTRKVTD